MADRNRAQKHVARARIILGLGERLPVARVAQRAGVGRPAVWRWQQRFAEAGVDGLLRDAHPQARQGALGGCHGAARGRADLRRAARRGAHWTGRAMAQTAGISLRSVQRIWAAHDLQPHRIRTFKRSSDPEFAAKLEDIVGLYMDPPKHAIVLSVDEKSCVDGPRLAREKLACGIIRLLCGHVSGLLTRSSHDRWPRWVPRTRASSDPRDFVPRLLQAAPGPSAQPITPSRSFPRKRHGAGKLGLCRDCLPIALPLRHHGPNDACHLVGQSHGDHEAGSSGQQALDPRIGPGCLRAQQDGLGSDDQQLTDVFVAEPADPAQPLLATGGLCRGTRPSQAANSRPPWKAPGSGTVAAIAEAVRTALMDRRKDSAQVRRLEVVEFRSSSYGSACPRFMLPAPRSPHGHTIRDDQSDPRRAWDAASMMPVTNGGDTLYEVRARWFTDLDGENLTPSGWSRGTQRLEFEIPIPVEFIDG